MFPRFPGGLGTPLSGPWSERLDYRNEALHLCALLLANLYPGGVLPVLGAGEEQLCEV